MKTTIKMTYKIKTAAMLLILSLGFGLTGCLKDKEGTPTPPAAFISIYHGSTDAPSLDVFANSNRVTTNPFRYTEMLPYSRYYLGERTFKFSPYNAVTSLLEKKFNIEKDVVYSMFFTGMEDNLDAILLTDKWAVPNQTRAQLRFVHLSPDAGLVEIQLKEGDSAFVDNSDFKTFSSFEDLNSGTFNIKVVSKMTGQTLVTANNVELRGNRVYTLVLRGLHKEGTAVEKRLNLQLITNFINF